MKIKNNKKKILMLFLTLTMLTSSLLVSVGPTVYSVNAEKSPVMRILCRFEDGRTLANMHSTDYFHYLFRSKSAVTNTESVNSYWMNRILTVAGYDFVAPNEAILGREIRPVSLPEDELITNQGPKVSAFDRFGVAGLTWSSYQGEWKYNYVEACANQNQVSPTNYGAFYEGRLEPKSTHNEVSTSKDPRSIQFDKGVLSSISSAAKDTFANGLFGVTKVVVSLTIVFVGLAFSDITTLMGLSADGTAGVTAAGMFSDIFNTIFMGFVVFSILFTAVYILYNGLFKRQFRMAIGTLVKIILIFIISIIMSTNPSYWVGIPNKVATYGQALVLGSMAGMYENDTSYPSLCSTDVASIGDGANLNDLSDGTTLLSEFEKVNKNMKSLIGCQMWEQLLFKPWVRGQFGAEYEDLNVDSVGNINSSWVGNASVPMGNGQTIDNWALFHLSTQTDAHSQVGESNFPTRVNGVNADWWRTVDALSNYDEAETTDSIGNGAHSETYIDRVDSDPTDFWQSWVGNNATERMGTAVIATTFGIMGSVAPLIFSFSSALYGLGITLLMMTSPIFLLFGTLGGKGDGIFKGWLSALINMVIKRIGVSILLILSLAITMNIMDLAYTIGIIKSFLLMIIVTFVLVKNKNKMLDMLASVDLGGAFDPRTQANRFLNTQKRHAKNVGKVGLATAGGVKAGIQTGQGAARGAQIGARSQIRNMLYQSQLGMNVIRELDITSDDLSGQLHNCSVCYKLLGGQTEEIAYRDDDGNYYCVECSDEMGIEHLHEVTIGTKEDKEPIVKINETRTRNATGNRSYLSHSKVREMMKPRVINDKFYWDDDKMQSMIKDNVERLREDTVVFSNLSRIYGVKSRPPAPPEPLQSYIDIALINKAWTDGRTDVVENTYKEAWKMWYEDNASHVEGITQDDINTFKKELENFNIDIDIEKTHKLMKEFTTSKDSDEFGDKDLYIHRNGKLVLNMYDRNVDYKNRTGNDYENEIKQELKKVIKKDKQTNE